MQVIGDNGNKGKGRKKGVNHTYVIGGILVAIGFLLMGRNLGFINNYLFHILISWQMLLIVIGLWSFTRRKVTNGLVLVALGAFFMIPELTGAGRGWIHTYWPLWLVIAGLAIIYNRSKPVKKKGDNYSVRSDYKSKDGYVESENVFGSLQQVILEDIFRGGEIKNTFGGTKLDLRRTKLEPGVDTLVNIDCTFGGIEILVPENWIIVIDIKPFLSGIDDKRSIIENPAGESYRLVLTGKATFSGIEIKN